VSTQTRLFEQRLNQRLPNRTVFGLAF